MSRAENNGQQSVPPGRAQNNGQRSKVVSGSRSPQDRWGSEDNMRVPATDKDADFEARED